MSKLEQRIKELEQRIHSLDAEREALFQELTLLKHQSHEKQQSLIQLMTSATLNRQSSSKDKIKLFRDLFKGRDDVYPKRYVNSKSGKPGYSPVCSNEWKPNVCDKPRIKCGKCQFRWFIPVSDPVIANHLADTDNARNPRADFVIGVYPLMPDERCWFLAVDFDKAAWQQDVRAFVAACKENNIPYSIERSLQARVLMSGYFLAPRYLL
jgi:hypothetical protein